MKVRAACVAPLRGYPHSEGGTEYCAKDRFAFIGKAVIFVPKIQIEKEDNYNEKTWEELERELYEAAVKLEQYRHQQERLENRISDFKEVQRRKRNHRLITRGAEIESVAPEVRGMSQSTFRILAEQIFSLPEVTALVSLASYQQEDD